MDSDNIIDIDINNNIATYFSSAFPASSTKNSYFPINYASSAL